MTFFERYGDEAWQLKQDGKTYEEVFEALKQRYGKEAPSQATINTFPGRWKKIGKLRPAEPSAPRQVRNVGESTRVAAELAIDPVMITPEGYKIFSKELAMDLVLKGSKKG